MIVPDINLLVYAHNERATDHVKARAWWEGCLNGAVPVGLPWVSIAGFLRLMTHPRVLVQPMEVAVAVARVREWLEQPPVRILSPGLKFPGLFLGQLERLGTAGNLTTDAQLAALAMEYQAELHSNDADFARFPGLRWVNPLA
ncbi:MAG: type II toxin-antitoxin system VapC family toxin [Opitutaceae bacterium]|nr:type II toxin-antitoxin system VapC family toxin [Opitutaceae bacterium]